MYQYYLYIFIWFICIKTQIKDADVQIDLANSNFGNQPYTVQAGGCGQPGEHIHITSDYILGVGTAQNTADFGLPENTLVRQWAHLRYGVFDEFGVVGDKQFPLFYRPQGTVSTISPTVCTDQDPAFTTS